MSEGNEGFDFSKVPKEVWGTLLIVLLLLGFLGVSCYAIHLENKYNECVIEFNEFAEKSNPYNDFKPSLGDANDFERFIK